MINLAQPPHASLIRSLAQPHFITAQEMELIHDQAVIVMHDNIYMPYNDAVRLAIDETLCLVD
jgi:hypothetical protein